MAKKPNGRFLLTWNDKKHPEVTAFFAEIEEGLYSHTLREAITFYMQHKDNDDIKVKSNTSSHEESNNDDYDDFNPSDL